MRARALRTTEERERERQKEKRTFAEQQRHLLHLSRTDDEVFLSRTYRQTEREIFFFVMRFAKKKIQKKGFFLACFLGY
jgi:hypothetical protein